MPRAAAGVASSDSAFTTQLSSHANELHPKQRASVELFGHGQVARLCAEAVNEIHPSLHFAGQFQLSQIRMRNPFANISKHLPAQLDNSGVILLLAGG